MTIEHLNYAKVTILGCGTSGGVPQLHSGWGQCNPNQPKNLRHRCSILIESKHSLLVDTTPECRIQLLEKNISKIKAILYTHNHADHCHGIDETRWICMAGDNPLDVYGFAEHLDDLQERFAYAWVPLQENNKVYYRPVLQPHPIQENHLKMILNMPVLPLKLNHGFSKVMGVRIGDFAYTTDVMEFKLDQLNALRGLKTWVVDCLRYDPHPTHAHLSRTLTWIADIKPEQAYLTHMNNDMDYDKLADMLPIQIMPAYDGLQFTIRW